ncbi:MAG: hypothetical protein MI861_06630, partial [Pirellulales bacterium]|nr:hypothetical protein [Pirellulales bacterium]
MSQADFQPSSASSSNAAAPPPETAAVPPPPPSQPVQVPVPGRGKTSSDLDQSVASVPPPPPPRSTPAPVRPVGEPSPPGDGVGSAKGVRWRGELNQLDKTPKTKPANGSTAPAAAPGEEEEGKDQVHLAKEAPPWLVSMVFHLVLLLILALISSPAGNGLGHVILTIGKNDGESDVELIDFGLEAEVT